MAMILITPAAAKHLAIAYEAFINAPDASAVLVWGDLLRRAQARLGVTLVDDRLIEARVDYARRQLRQEASR